MLLLNVYLENVKLSLLNVKLLFKEQHKVEDFYQILLLMKDVVMNYLIDVMMEVVDQICLIVKFYLHVLILPNHLDVKLVYVLKINIIANLIKI
jgi:hypothetical protein